MLTIYTHQELYVQKLPTDFKRKAQHMYLSDSTQPGAVFLIQFICETKLYMNPNDFIIPITNFPEYDTLLVKLILYFEVLEAHKVFHVYHSNLIQLQNCKHFH
ncbi:CLUMA_CG019336, isoform A [Clunio marinus]|uniref:CLUMA_CG019336, isoform A n=1 Tax=Clunio marinus TaxID=568069 RepID=A0A1J1J1V8_9DIPT|nr:CLUMA_CG019336, isoform A [Clunio marinus]